MRKTCTLLFLLSVLAACGADESGSVDPCPGGDLVSVDEDDFCVAEAVVIEKGFLCPEELPNQFEYEDVVVCAGEEDIPEEKLQEVYTEYREDNPPANNGANNGTNNGANNGANNGENNGENNGCVDADADGFCAPDDCDDGNSAVAPGLPEIPINGIDDDCDGLVDEEDRDEPDPECRQDADCENGLACFRGECAMRCRVDNDCREEKQCIMDHCLDPPEGCESDVDCQRGEVCLDGSCAAAGGRDCRTDADCADGEACVDGTCMGR